MTTITEAPDASTIFKPNYELNVGYALMWVKTVKRRSGVYWWATQTPAGSASTAFRIVGGEVRADSWGAGADWAIAQLPALLGNNDDPSDFRPLDPVVSELMAQFGSLRIGATGRWYESLATMTLGQRVVRADALSSVNKLGRRYGETPPVESPVPLFPTPSAILKLADHDLHRVGVERSRARVLRIAAKYADRLEGLDDVPPADARAWLQRLPGVGPWTAGLTTGGAAGDPDAVPIGDLHVPSMVTYALAREEQGNNARMLELLEPYAGHRGRVVRMIKGARAGPEHHAPAPFRYDISSI